MRRGDVIDIEISRKKFHVFDKETEKSIRRRIPEENIINSTVTSGVLSFEGRKLYNFFMNIGNAKLVPTDSICEKLFACKGNKIFHTPLEYIF